MVRAEVADSVKYPLLSLKSRLNMMTHKGKETHSQLVVHVLSNHGKWQQRKDRAHELRLGFRWNFKPWLETHFSFCPWLQLLLWEVGLHEWPILSLPSKSPKSPGRQWMSYKKQKSRAMNYENRRSLFSTLFVGGRSGKTQPCSSNQPLKTSNLYN